MITLDPDVVFCDFNMRMGKMWGYSSPTTKRIDKYLDAPTPVLRYLTSSDVLNLNDVLELGPTNAVIVVGYSPLYRPGQPVTEHEVKWHGPRRYLT